MSKTIEAIREYSRNYRKEQREKDPVKVRAQTRKHVANWRKNHREAARTYINEYIKEWLKDPINYRCHSVRTQISNIRLQLKKNPLVQFRESNRVLLENLLKVGWSVDLPDTKCTNHIISLQLLVKFNQKLPVYVLSDHLNLEICDRTTNSKAVKRKINKKMLKVAQKLERKFPEWLVGFTNYLDPLEGTTI